MRKYIVSLLLLCLLASGANSAADLGNSSVISPVDSSNGSGTCPSWLGSAAPSTLDDSGRCLQGAIAREWQNRSFAVTSTGSANSYVVAYTVPPAALRTGQVYSFITNFGNTGTATVNINSLGAKTIKKDVAGTLTALSSGDMGSGQYVMLAYNGTDMIWVNWQGAATDLSAYAPLASANTFTANQTISTTAADASLTLRYNKGSAGAANDELGQINFNGKDAASADANYAFIDALVSDPAAASKDGYLRFGAVVANSSVVSMLAGNGVLVDGATTGGFQGAGTINATEYYKNGVALSTSSMTLLSTLTTTSGTTQSATGLAASTYRKYYIEVDGVSFTNTAALTVAISGDNGTNYGTVATISATSTTEANTRNGSFEIGGINIPQRYGASLISGSIQMSTGTAGVALDTLVLGKNATGATGAVDAIQFAGGTFDAGEIRIYGVK